MRTTNRAAVVLATMSLAVPLVLTPPASADHAGSAAYDTRRLPGEFLAVVDSEALGTPVVVSGTVAAADGGAVAGGHVLVAAFPSEDVMNRAGDASSGFDWTAVWRAEIRRDGSFEARVAPSVDLRRLATDGIVNLQVWAIDGAGLAQWGFSRHVDERGALVPVEDGDEATLLDPTQAPAPAARTAVAMSVARSTPSLGAPRVELMIQPVSTATGSAEQRSAVPGPGWDCEHRGRMTHRQVALGHIYHARRGMHHQFMYKVTSSSTLGYAVKIGNGAYSQGGTTTKHSSDTTYWRKSNGLDKRWYYTYWDYDIYNCREPHPTGEYKIWNIVPGPHRAGHFARSASRTPSAGHCTGGLQKGGRWIVERGTATTVSNGVNMDGAIGIDLSARSGFNVETKHVFWPKRWGRKVCGSTDLPNQDKPGYVVIKT